MVRRDTLPISAQVVAENLNERIAVKGRDAVVAEMQKLQIAVYVMCNGGLLGSSAAYNPRDFYIDDRCGKLPYSRRQIMQAVRVLAIYQDVLGIEKMPRNQIDFHSCGVW